MRQWKEAVGALLLPVVFICSTLRPKSSRPEHWSLVKVNMTSIHLNRTAVWLKWNVAKHAGGGHAAASGSWETSILITLYLLPFVFLASMKLCDLINSVYTSGWVSGCSHLWRDTQHPSVWEQDGPRSGANAGNFHQSGGSRNVVVRQRWWGGTLGLSSTSF